MHHGSQLFAIQVDWLSHRPSRSELIKTMNHVPLHFKMSQVFDYMDDDETYALKGVVFRAANRYYCMTNDGSQQEPSMLVNGVDTEDAIKQMINRYPRVKPHLLLYEKCSSPLSVKS